MNKILLKMTYNSEKIIDNIIWPGKILSGEWPFVIPEKVKNTSYF
jgi:hypothetical protein